MLLLLLIITLLIVFFLIYYFFFSPKSQLFGLAIYRGEPAKNRTIALTFDDGPNDPYTSRLLDILKKYNIKATFFVVGENIKRYPETFKKIFTEGHIIGNHSYSHSFFSPMISATYENQISKTQKLIKDIIGKKPTLFRPPWFFRQPQMLKTAKKYGLTTVTGTFASYREVFQVDGEIIAADAIKKAKPGTILVFHDGYNNKTAKRSETIEAVKILIPKLLANGYKFVTLPELIGISEYQ